MIQLFWDGLEIDRYSHLLNNTSNWNVLDFMLLEWLIYIKLDLRNTVNIFEKEYLEYILKIITLEIIAVLFDTLVNGKWEMSTINVGLTDQCQISTPFQANRTGQC